MNNRESAINVEHLLEELVAWAQAQEELLALYLYGSHAEGRATALSDVDVALLAREGLSRRELWRLEDRAAAQWPDVVDLRLLNLAPLSFRYQVTARGRRLWAADLDAVATWVSLTWRRYWDFRPMLERDWEYYVKHLEEKRDEVERREYQESLAKVRAVHHRVREAAADNAIGLEE